MFLTSVFMAIHLATVFGMVLGTIALDAFSSGR